MENILDDLLTEILIRLPDSRQAVRCAAVCKGWSSLVGGDQFARSFVAHHRSLDDADFSVAVVPLLFEWPGCDYRKIPILPYEYYVIGEIRAVRAGNYLSFLPWENFAIRAYCDDLLLVSKTDGGSGRLSLCVCNPMTKKYWCGIPEAPGFNNGPFKLLFTCRRGGENGVHHKYHVTVFFDYYNLNGDTWTVDFSFETGQWSSPTRVHLPSDSHFSLAHLFFTEPVTCGDGLVYWLGGKFPLWERVIAFDPSAAASPDGHRDFRVIQIPVEASEYHSIFATCLGTYRGRLRATYMNNSSALRIWELNHASSCWSLVLDAALGSNIPRCIYPLALHPGDRNAVFLQKSNEEILQYDMLIGTSQTLCQLLKESCPYSVYPLCSIWPTPVPSLETAVKNIEAK